LANKTVAVVGGESLIARELQDLFAGLKPAPEVHLISGEADSAKILRDQTGEAMVLTPLSALATRDAAAVFLAGSAASSRQALDMAGEDGPVLIDLTGALEDHPRARLRAPLLEPAARADPPGTIHIVVHPAAFALALFYSRLANRFPIERSVANIFEPASERGHAGLKELQAQTVNLLSFKPLPQDVFDTQLGFSMLARYGEEAPRQLAEAEARIDRHLATLLAMSARMPMPSLRLSQAPVFHGYSCSIWVEFQESPGVAPIEEALASAQIEIRRADEEAPSNVGVAGQSGLSAGDIRQDRNNPRAFWFWVAADNLRLLAETAVAAAREYL
jgi:aspartate-semialdehyde dehydrogenase